MNPKPDKLDVYSMSFKLPLPLYQKFSKWCFDRRIKMSVVMREMIEKKIRENKNDTL